MSGTGYQEIAPGSALLNRHRTRDSRGFKAASRNQRIRLFVVIVTMPIASLPRSVGKKTHHNRYTLPVDLVQQRGFDRDPTSQLSDQLLPHVCLQSFADPQLDPRIA